MNQSVQWNERGILNTDQLMKTPRKQRLKHNKVGRAKSLEIRGEFIPLPMKNIGKQWENKKAIGKPWLVFQTSENPV